MYAENHAIVFQHFEWVRQKKMKNSKLAFPELYFFFNRREKKERQKRRSHHHVLNTYYNTGRLLCYTHCLNWHLTIAIWDSFSRRPSKPWGGRPLVFDEGKVFHCLPILHVDFFPLSFRVLSESSFNLLPCTMKCG